jgi:DNA-binding NarL/FixJ family response regulator
MLKVERLPPDAGNGDELIRELLDAFDFGVLVVSGPADKVLFCNAMASHVLEELGAAPSGAPIAGPLRKVILQGLSEAAAGRFTRATALSLPSGLKYYVRVRRLSRTAERVLVLLAPAVIRERDLSELLQRRFGLSARKAQVAILIRDGLSNEDIARVVKLTSGTVKQYASEIFAALQVHSRTEFLVAIQKEEQ